MNFEMWWHTEKRGIYGHIKKENVKRAWDFQQRKIDILLENQKAKTDKMLSISSKVLDIIS